MITRALLVEDEAPQREALKTMLSRLWPDLDVRVCEDGIEALEAIASSAPEVAFLDIRLPGVDGLRIARALPERTRIVFTTAYDQHAIAAFEAGAIDYLMKPITEERLIKALDRVRAGLDAPNPPIEPLLATLESLKAKNARAPMRWISASVGDVVRLIGIEDVHAFQSRDKYTRVLARGGEAIIRLSLRELLDQLDAEQFVQVHRSLIVRVTAIERLQKDELGNWRLRLHGNEEWFPVSQTVAGKFRGM